MPIEFHPELVRFAFVLGIVVSIAFYDRDQVTTGGIAVPGYLAFTIFLPLVAPAVLALSLITWALVYKVIAARLIMSGSARFSLTILISAGLHFVVDAGLELADLAEPTSPLLRGIGYVVPGLIAHDFTRHGIGRSVANITATTSIVAAALAAAVMLRPELSMLYTSPVQDVFPFHLDFTPMVVFLSLIAWLGIARYRDWRSGGFLGAAYMTLLVMQPVELALFWGMAILTLLIVKFVIEPLAIIFGRRKLAAHLLVGASLSWFSFRVREIYFEDHTLSVATPSITVIGVLLTGLLANDIDRVGFVRTLAGSATSVVFSLIVTLLLLELVYYGRPWIAAPLLCCAVLVAVLLFARLRKPDDTVSRQEIG